MQLPNEKGILCTNPASSSIAISNSKTMIPLAVQNSNEVISCDDVGNKLTIDNDGYVVVGKNVKRILILGKVYLSNDAVDSSAIPYDYLSTINMIRNSEVVELDWSVGTGVNSRVSSWQGARQATHFAYVNVTEGDKIYLAGRINGASSDVTGLTSATRTKLIFIIL